MIEETTSPEFTGSNKNERTVYKIAQDFSRNGDGAEITEILNEYENRVPLDPLVSRDTRRTTATKALRSLLVKGWLIGDEGVLALPRTAPAPPVVTCSHEPPPKREVTLSELEAALPELEELVNAIKTINRWARVFEAIRKAG